MMVASRVSVLAQHCWLEPRTDTLEANISRLGLQTGSVVQLDTVGWSQKPTLFPVDQCRFLRTDSDVNPHHCRYATVGSKSGSEWGF